MEPHSLSQMVFFRSGLHAFHIIPQLLYYKIFHKKTFTPQVPRSLSVVYIIHILLCIRLCEKQITFQHKYVLLDGKVTCRLHRMTLKKSVPGKV